MLTSSPASTARLMQVSMPPRFRPVGCEHIIYVTIVGRTVAGTQDHQASWRVRLIGMHLC
ncbi:hypothetical protein HGG75_25660 [Ochrobactrum pseudogrignonense]|nr:hypothetical protein [Brucella pseudogrignonensis]